MLFPCEEAEDNFDIRVLFCGKGFYITLLLREIVIASAPSRKFQYMI